MANDDDDDDEVARARSWQGPSQAELYRGYERMLRGYERLDQSLKDTVRRLDESIREMRASNDAIETRFEAFARDLRIEFSQKYTTKDKFAPVERIAYMIITVIVIGVLGFVGAAVTRGPPTPSSTALIR